MITIFGWISAVFLLLVLAKFLAKRLRIKRLNVFFMKYHRTFTRALIAASTLHTLLALLSLSTFSPLVIISGILGMLTIIIASRSQKRHSSKKWLRHHRFFAASTLFLIICHIILHVRH